MTSKIVGIKIKNYVALTNFSSAGMGTENEQHNKCWFALGV